VAFLVSIFCRTFVEATLIPTGADFDESVELRRKPNMETLEAIKTILEIIAIFITFPQYAPVLAVVVALGAMYYLIEDEDENSEQEQSATNISEATEQRPDTKKHPSTKTPPEAKP
jgi:flagellar biosynthesis component FlhA